MKIVLYGISRAGKSTFIERLCNNHQNITPLKGSQTLYKAARKGYGKSFEALDNETKMLLRSQLIKEFENESKKHQNVIVDGHFSFPKDKDGEFEVVTQQADIDFYDLFIYMYKPAHLILKNAQEANKEEWKKYLEVEENINHWQQYEIISLKAKLKDRDKELVILNEDLSVCEDYIASLVNGEIKTTDEIAKEVVDEILSKQEIKEVFLLDCDKTLSINDITDFVIEKKDIDKSEVVANFKGDFYTQYQSFRFHKHILKNNISPFVEEGVKRIELNLDLIEDIKKTNIKSVALTLGLADIWSVVNNNHNIFTAAPYIVGKKDSNKLYLSSFVKYLIGKKLKENGVKVYAAGDSFADLMLLEEANKSWIVVNKKLSSSAQKYFLLNPHSKIHQITYTEHEYENLKKEKKICLK